MQDTYDGLYTAEQLPSLEGQYRTPLIISRTAPRVDFIEDIANGLGEVMSNAELEILHARLSS